MEANPRPKPGRSQSSVGLVCSYSFSLVVCQLSKASMATTKENQVILVSVGRLNLFQSKKNPQKTLALLAAKPEVREAKVRARTEKLLIRVSIFYSFVQQQYFQ